MGGSMIKSWNGKVREMIHRPSEGRSPCESGHVLMLSDCSDSESESIHVSASAERLRPVATSETLGRVNLISATSVTTIRDGSGCRRRPWPELWNQSAVVDPEPRLIMTGTGKRHFRPRDVLRATAAFLASKPSATLVVMRSTSSP